MKPVMKSNTTASRMTASCTLTIALVGLVPMGGGGATLEGVSPQFGTNTAIVWQAPTNLLPSRFWTYKRLPQVF